MNIYAMTVAEIMTRSVFYAKKDMPVSRLISEFCSQHLHSAPVVAEDLTLVGIVSIRDVMKMFMTNYIALIPSLDKVSDADLSTAMSALRINEDLTVADIMRAAVKFVWEDTPVIDAAAMMFTSRVHRLPVTRGRSLVGIVSQSDVMRTMAVGLRSGGACA